MTALPDRLRAEADEWEEGEAIASLLREAAAALEAAEQRAQDAERETGQQMASKLEAQMALKAIADALNLPLSELGNGWTKGAKVILARIEMIVDEAERGFRERNTEHEHRLSIYERALAAEARADQLQAAAQKAMREIGVPHDGYPASVARAWDILADAVIVNFDPRRGNSLAAAAAPEEKP